MDRKAIPELKAKGLSNRKIAKMTGLSRTTVANDLAGNNLPESGNNLPESASNDAISASNDAPPSALPHCGDFETIEKAPANQYALSDGRTKQKTLSDAGITKQRASEWERLAGELSK
ncbi:MAG: helix-turn-helix domain-containing protein, partial [Methylocella sp.]